MYPFFFLFKTYTFYLDRRADLFFGGGVREGGAENFVCFDSYFKIMGNKYLNWTLVKYNLGLSHGR